MIVPSEFSWLGVEKNAPTANCLHDTTEPYVLLL